MRRKREDAAYLCRRTGKQRFTSEGAALRTLRRLRAQAEHDERRHEQRVYECGHCRGWHLTSMEKRTA